MRASGVVRGAPPFGMELGEISGWEISPTGFQSGSLAICCGGLHGGEAGVRPTGLVACARVFVA